MNAGTAPKRYGRAVARLAVIVWCWPSLLFAQDFQDLAPKQPIQTRQGKIITGPGAGSGEVAGVAGPPDHTAILDELKGLRFIADAREVVKEGTGSPGLDVSSVPDLDDPDLGARLTAYLGRPLTFADLHAITRTVIDFLRAHGRPLSDVAIPEQDVAHGVVQIVVTEFRLGRVTVSGNHRFSNTVIRKGVELAPGKPLDLDRLKHDLDWLNRNPFRRVDAVLARGDKIGTTDIQLHVQEQFPLRVYAAFDNSGTPATGRDRWSVGANFGNLFGRDQQLSYQFTAGDDFLRHPADGKARFVAQSASLVVPLVWHDLVEVFGLYARQSPDIGPFFGQTGHSWQASMRYVHPLGGPAWLGQEMQLGFDHKSTDNNLAFGGIQVFSATQGIDQFLFNYDATATDPWGATTLQNDLAYSPGGLSADNTDAAFARSGTVGAKARYVYDTISLTRATPLPYQAAWVTRVRAQWADGNLLPSEQLGGGGEDSVRGYDPRVANGSQGVLVREELRSPPFGPGAAVFGEGIKDSGQLLAFWDYARLSDPRTQPGYPAHFTLGSAGVGLDYVLGRTLDLKFDFGWQLETPPGARMRGTLADVSLSIGY